MLKINRFFFISILIGALVLTYCSEVTAQEKHDNRLSPDQYTILKNDPKNIPSFSFIVTSGAYNINTTGGVALGGGLGGMFDLSEKVCLSLNGIYQYPWNIINTDISSLIQGSSEKRQPWQEYDIGGTWYPYCSFIKTLENFKFEVRRKRTQIYQIPDSVELKLGIRSGFSEIILPFYCSTKFSAFNSFTGYNVSDPVKKKILMTGTYATNMDIDMIHVGLSYEIIKDYIIKLNDPSDGKTEGTYKTQFYADFLFAPIIDYSNIIITKNTYPIISGTYNVNDFSPKSTFGFRLGYSQISYNDLFKETYEIGYLPGPKGMGLYLLVKGGLCFSFN